MKFIVMFVIRMLGRLLEYLQAKKDVKKEDVKKGANVNSRSS